MIIQTPIGALSFSASVQNRTPAADEAIFRHVQLEPRLPPGMSVKSLEAVLVELKPHVPLQTVTVAYKWLSIPKPWDDRPTGECLEAQSWVVENMLVLIGTEDLDCLAVRLTEHDLSDAHHLVSYYDDGFEIVLPRVPAHQITSLHFIVASNHHPEPVDCSAWYAIDVPHAHVRAITGEG